MAREYADPTAWAAIANVERKERKRVRKHNQTKHRQVGVYRDKTITNKQAHITSVQTLVRPENISLPAKFMFAKRRTKE